MYYNGYLHCKSTVKFTGSLFAIKFSVYLLCKSGYYRFNSPSSWLVLTSFYLTNHETEKLTRLLLSILDGECYELDLEEIPDNGMVTPSWDPDESLTESDCSARCMELNYLIYAMDEGKYCFCFTKFEGKP